MEEEEEEEVQTKSLNSSIVTPLQRQVGEVEEETVAAKGLPGQTPQVSAGLESSIQALRSVGQPLPESARAFFEPRFGHDFGQVHIHFDSRAGTIARSINAKALTLGRDIIFGSGEYSPETSVGKWLLAHELTHTIQQDKICPPILQCQEESSKTDEKKSSVLPDLKKESKPLSTKKDEEAKEKPETKAADQGGKVCLTFDDGPGTGTKEVLEALGSTVPATFFLIGNKITKGTSDLVKVMIERKNIQIGNHTFSHYPARVADYKKEFGDLTTDAQQKAFKEWFQETSKRLDELGIKLKFKLARLPGGGPKVKKPKEPKKPNEPKKENYKSSKEYDRAFKKYKSELKKYETELKEYEEKLKEYQFYKNLQKKMLEILENKKYGLGLKHVGWNSEFTTHEQRGFKHVKHLNWQGVEKVRCEDKGFPNGILLFHDSHWTGNKERLDKLLKKLNERRSFGQLNDEGQCG